ncbi:unnamed protein product [Caenorhabditis nigoni]
MNLSKNLENGARKRKNSPKKYCNIEKMNSYKTIKPESSGTETDGYGEEYKQLHKYIKPRRMSIYAPDFRYGPNRWDYWPQDLSDTDDDDEDEEKKVDEKCKKENHEEGSSEDESSSEDSGDEHEEKEDDEEDAEETDRDETETANGDKTYVWEKVISLQKVEFMMEAEKKVSANE